MAHIHLEDGSFSLLFVFIWWVTALALIAIALYTLRPAQKPDQKRITLAAFCAAAAFVVFQVEIPIAGGVHISLTPLIGILAGPVLGLLIVFVTNILSAAVGHGGWGLIGANTLVNFSEALVAYGIFQGLRSLVPDLFWRAGTATLGGLLVGNCVMIGIVLISGIQGVTQSQEQILLGLSFLAAINMGVAVIEALMTGLVVAYIGKMRPDLLAGRAR
jgi:cobalt/nickel transport system permease protein